MTESRDNLRRDLGSAWHVNSDQATTDIGHITGAGAPTAVPAFVGQEYYDTTAKAFYRATDTVATAWLKFTENPAPTALPTALNTVGAGTVTGAGIAGGLTTRGGAQSGTPFTDITDTAVAIIAGVPGAQLNQSWTWIYQNNTNAVATLTNGVGVTIVGNTIIPAGAWVQYLVQVGAASTITLTAETVGQLHGMPPTQFKTAALAAGTLAAGLITGAEECILQNTGATPGAQTVRTAAQMLADTPGGYVGLSTKFRIVNTGAGTLTLTADGGATVTLAATGAHNAVLTNTWVDYVLTFNTATTATIQAVGAGTSP
jgi:hypothetical protein